MASYEDIVNHLLGNKSNLTASDSEPKLSQALQDQIYYKYSVGSLDTNKIEEGSVFDDIQKDIDLDHAKNGEDTLERDLLRIMNKSSGKWTGSKELWNESVKYMVQYMVDKFLSEDAVIPVDPQTGLGSSEQGGFKVSDIKKANAGLSFEKTAWVKPNYNIDNETYDKVRGNDKIEQVLNNQKHMQFTRTQDQSKIADEENSPISKYLRLLMPKYIRRVEVEDLNRNFWVLGQTVSAISAFLFEDDSPITNMFKRFCNEINQLWENILYLWVSQNKPITKVHCEVLYLPNNSSMTQKKYDNFDVVPTFDNIQERLNYLKDQYCDSNLCIMPIIRRKNYFKDYYQIERYIGIWFYDRNKDAWSHITPSSSWTSGDFAEYKTIDDVTYLEINPDINKISGIYIDEEEFKYKFCYPLSNLPNIEKELMPTRYFGGLRTKPYFTNCQYKYDNNENDFGFSGTFKIEITDYAAEVTNKGNKEEIYSWNFSNNEFSGGTRRSSGTVPSETSEIENTDIEKGFYLGEIPTSFEKTSEIDYSIKNQPVSFPPVDETVYQIETDSNLKNKLQKYSVNGLGAQEISAKTQITLYTGSYINSIFSSEEGKSNISYYVNSLGDIHTDTIGDNRKDYDYVMQNGNITTTISTPLRNGSDREEGCYFNRTRETIKLGCILKIPNIGNTYEFEDYEYWQTHIPSYNDENSLIPLYTEDDPNNSGRREGYYSFTTFYNKKENGSKIKPDSWAIKYTEVHMNFAPTSNTGYEVVSEVNQNIGEYLTLIYNGVPDSSWFLNGNHTEYAPFTRVGSAEELPSGTKYNFFPVITRVVTHIFIGDGNKYARRHQYRLGLDGSTSSGYSWNSTLRDTKGENYNNYQKLLNNSYSVLRRASTVVGDTAKDVVKMITENKCKEVKKDKNGNIISVFLDFEKYPINGYSH